MPRMQLEFPTESLTRRDSVMSLQGNEFSQ